jgi:hypothetical protein
MKVTLPNGVTVEGTYEQVVDIAKLMGFNSRGYYHSSSKGWLKVTEMETAHLRNAILKMQREWAENLSTVKSHDELVSLLNQGLGGTNRIWAEMVMEYDTRDDDFER